MRDYFIVSLCKNGILGGAITADEAAVTYHTGKVTVPAKYRRLEMKYQYIVSVTNGWLLFFPTVTLKMREGEEYKFLVFARKRFLNRLRSMGVSI